MNGTVKGQSSRAYSDGDFKPYAEAAAQRHWDEQSVAVWVM